MLYECRFTRSTLWIHSAIRRICVAELECVSVVRDRLSLAEHLGASIADGGNRVNQRYIETIRSLQPYVGLPGAMYTAVHWDVQLCSTLCGTFYCTLWLCHTPCCTLCRALYLLRTRCGDRQALSVQKNSQRQESGVRWVPPNGRWQTGIAIMYARFCLQCKLFTFYHLVGALWRVPFTGSGSLAAIHCRPNYLRWRRISAWAFSAFSVWPALPVAKLSLSLSLSRSWRVSPHTLCTFGTPCASATFGCVSMGIELGCSMCVLFLSLADRCWRCKRARVSAYIYS